MVKEYIKRKILSYQWRKDNAWNETAPGNVFDISLVSVGKHSYGRIHALTFNDTNKLRIGNYCSIAPNVMFMLSADHETNRVSTFPFRVKIVKDQSTEGYSKGDIVIDDDVWIGYGATILSGVHIGQGAVVAAGAMVSKDVPPYAIVGGIPAKVIKYRFDQAVTDFFLTLDYSALTEPMIRDHIDDLYLELSSMDLSDIQKLYTWFPKKA